MPEVLPELAGVAAALVLLLIAAGLWVIAEMIRRTFGGVPVIGGWIASNIAGAADNAAITVLSWASATWGFCVHLFDTIAAWLWRPLYAVISAINDAATAVYNISRYQIPNAIYTAEIYAYNGFSNALSYAEQVWTDSTGYAYDLWQSATGYALNLYHDAVNYASAAAGNALNYAEQVWTDATGYTAQVYADVLARIGAADAAIAGAATSAVATAESYADTLWRQAEADIASGLASASATSTAALDGVRAGVYTDLQSWGDGAITQAWPDAAGDIGALRNALGGDFPDIQSILPWLAGAGVTGLSGALIRSMATSSALTRLATDCIVPNCRNLSGLGNDLESLLGDVSTAAMLAWFIFLVTDPAGWAQETQTAASGVVDTATSAARTLLGV